MKAIAIMVAIFTILTGIGWWESFKWHECIRVGHARLYCNLSLFSR